MKGESDTEKGQIEKDFTEWGERMEEGRRESLCVKERG